MASSIPPHNVGEICAALLHLIKTPKATVGKLVELMHGTVSAESELGKGSRFTLLIPTKPIQDSGRPTESH